MIFSTLIGINFIILCTDLQVTARNTTSTGSACKYWDDFILSYFGFFLQHQWNKHRRWYRQTSKMMSKWFYHVRYKFNIFRWLHFIDRCVLIMLCSYLHRQQFEAYKYLAFLEKKMSVRSNPKNWGKTGDFSAMLLIYILKSLILLHVVSFYNLGNISCR